MSSLCLKLLIDLSFAYIFDALILELKQRNCEFVTVNVGIGAAYLVACLFMEFLLFCLSSSLCFSSSVVLDLNPLFFVCFFAVFR